MIGVDDIKFAVRFHAAAVDVGAAERHEGIVDNHQLGVDIDVHPVDGVARVLQVLQFLAQVVALFLSGLEALIKIGERSGWRSAGRSLRVAHQVLIALHAQINHVGIRLVQLFFCSGNPFFAGQCAWVLAARSRGRAATPRRIGRDERTDVNLEPGNRPGFDD